MRDGYFARWRDEEYEASPDGANVRLYSQRPRSGFAEVRPDRYVRVVPVGEVGDVYYVRTLCYWHGQPFIVLGQHESWLRVEYTGGHRPVAVELGLEEYDFGVYQGWVLADEVDNLHEQRV